MEKKSLKEMEESLKELLYNMVREAETTNEKEKFELLKKLRDGAKIFLPEDDRTSMLKIITNIYLKEGYLTDALETALLLPSKEEKEELGNIIKAYKTSGRIYEAEWIERNYLKS